MNQYSELYSQARDLICRHSSPVMNAARDAAAEAFAHLGFPTRKVERYKYTDVAQAFEPDYGLNLSRLNIPVHLQDAFRCDVPNISTLQCFVVNDTPTNIPTDAADGLTICSLREAKHEWLKPYYGKLARPDKDAITALNTMMAQDGLFIHIAKGCELERPIQVVNILRSDVELMVNRRVLIVAEEGAKATLLFCDHTADPRRFLATQVAEVFVGEGADLQIYGLEENNTMVQRFSNVFMTQGANSHLTHAALTLQTGLSRSRMDINLTGENGKAELYGAVIADKQQHVDHNTLVDHQAPGCESSQLYKYVLDDKATGAFAGRILVREGMQQTISNMRNANLCGTPEARMFTQPMLEIYADDVQCSHGSTIGQMNDAALFYMQQRGIDVQEARTLLQQAFAAEVIEHISLAPLRDRLTHLVAKRFRGELAHCEGCAFRNGMNGKT